MHRRIGPFTKFLLIATSATLQTIGFFTGFIPGVGTLLEWFGYIIFFIWFAILGVKFMSGQKASQKMGAMAAGLLVDSIPFFGSLPAQLASVILVILITEEEDKFAAMKRAALAKAKQASRRPANDNSPRAANDNQEDEERQAA